jgi:hypothetical protein
VSCLAYCTLAMFLSSVLGVEEAANDARQLNRLVGWSALTSLRHRRSVIAMVKTMQQQRTGRL